VTVSVYDPLAYGPGEAGPFGGTQTDRVATLTVGRLIEAVRGFAYYLGRTPRDITTERLDEAQTIEGVTIPVGAHLLTLRNNDRLSGAERFAVVEEIVKEATGRGAGSEGTE
jgi:hypothetical protein